MRNRNMILRLVVATFIASGALSAFAKLMPAADRMKAMSAARAKYQALSAIPQPQRLTQTVAFMKKQPEFKEVEVAEDGNIVCLFKDNVAFTVMMTVPSLPEKKVLDLRMTFPVQQPHMTEPSSSSSLKHAFEFAKSPLAFKPNDLPESTHARIVNTLGNTAFEFAKSPQAFKPNDLPESTNARIVNALGTAFGDSCPKLRQLLTDKGYTVAAGTDATIETLMTKVKDLGVFYMQCHGGIGAVYDAVQRKKVEEYILVSGERYQLTKEEDLESLAVPGGAGGLLSSGYIGISWAFEDYQRGTAVGWTYPYFTISKKFIKAFWKFSNNSFVLVYGCTTHNIKDVMAEARVNASVYCGTSTLGTNDCHKWIQLVVDRMLGSNDSQVLPQEDYVAQRPFDWRSLDGDMRDKKRLYPINFTDSKGQAQSVSPVFTPNRGNFGLLAPSIKHLSPVPYELKLDLVGTFGADPGNGNRKVEIAGVAQVVHNWEPDKITIILPNDPLGASGEVKVFSRGRPSNARYLSKWIGDIKLRISGEGTLLFGADFVPIMIGDPWSFRELPGTKPVEQMVWNVFTTSGSTCSWSASGEEKNSEGKVINSWSGGGSPKCWLNENRGRQHTFGVGGVTDTYQKKMNLYLAIMDTFTYPQNGGQNPEVPIKLGDWMQGQTMFQASYDADYNVIGGRLKINDEPSKLSYGGKNASLTWDGMQCRYGMPRTAPR